MNHQVAVGVGFEPTHVMKARGLRFRVAPVTIPASHRSYKRTQSIKAVVSLTQMIITTALLAMLNCRRYTRAKRTQVNFNTPCGSHVENLQLVGASRCGFYWQREYAILSRMAMNHSDLLSIVNVASPSASAIPFSW